MQNVWWQNCSSLYGYRYMRVCLLAFSLDRKQGFDLKREGKLCSVQLFCIPYGVGLGWGTVPSLHIKQKKSAFSFDATGKVSVTKKKITDPNGHPNSQISPPLHLQMHPPQPNQRFVSHHFWHSDTSENTPRSLDLLIKSSSHNKINHSAGEKKTFYL